MERRPSRCVQRLRNQTRRQTMAQSHAVPVRDTLHKLFPAEFLIALAKATAAVKRVRKVSPVELFWTVVLGFGVGRERSIAGLRRAYEKTTGQTIEESSFYDRFTPGFAKMLKQAALRALEQGVGASRALQGHLAGFRDVILTDSTVVRLHDLLKKTYPGSRTNHSQAALKAHWIMSVSGAGKHSVRITPGRRHDGPVFRVGKWVAGKLLMFSCGVPGYVKSVCRDRCNTAFAFPGLHITRSSEAHSRSSHSRMEASPCHPETSASISLMGRALASAARLVSRSTAA